MSELERAHTYAQRGVKRALLAFSAARSGLLSTKTQRNKPQTLEHPIHFFFAKTKFHFLSIYSTLYPILCFNLHFPPPSLFQKEPTIPILNCLFSLFPFSLTERAGFEDGKGRHFGNDGALFAGSSAPTHADGRATRPFRHQQVPPGLHGMRGRSHALPDFRRRHFSRVARAHALAFGALHRIPHQRRRRSSCPSRPLRPHLRQTRAPDRRPGRPRRRPRRFAAATTTTAAASGGRGGLFRQLDAAVGHSARHFRVLRHGRRRPRRFSQELRGLIRWHAGLPFGRARTPTGAATTTTTTFLTPASLRGSGGASSSSCSAAPLSAASTRPRIAFLARHEAHLSSFFLPAAAVLHAFPR